MNTTSSIHTRSLTMKQLFRLATITLAVCSTALAFAQTSTATKPDNATGQCKDGTYSTAASKSGACRGHNGVKEWYTAATTPAATPARPSTPAVATVPSTATAAATTPSPSTQVKTQTQAAAQAASQSPVPPPTTSIQKPAATPITTAAPGAAPGMVWLNASSNVYHCPGTKYYGKTKSGSYMTEADAKAKGAHADHGNACSK
jgi:hypothetical protein